MSPEISALLRSCWSPPAPRDLLLVGGGRWARVWLAVVHGLLPPAGTIRVATTHQRAEMERWIAKRALGGGPGIRLGRLDELLAEHPAPAPVVVASATAAHARHATQALGRGHDVLVEKPIALSLEEGRALVEQAAAGGRRLAVNRSFAFATYLHEAGAAFRAAAPQRWTARIDWTDPANEVRPGGVKSRDVATPLAADCYPHVLSLCETALGVTPAISGCQIGRGGRRLEIEAEAGPGRIEIRLEREADQRRRALEVVADDTLIHLDFTNEPGRLTVAGRERQLAADWDRFPSPLRLSFGHFLRAAAGLSTSGVNLDRRCLDGLGEADRLIADTRRAQARLVAPLLSAALPSAPAPAIDEDRIYALCALFPATVAASGAALRSDEDCRRAADLLLRTLTSADARALVAPAEAANLELALGSGGRMRGPLQPRS